MFLFLFILNVAVERLIIQKCDNFRLGKISFSEYPQPQDIIPISIQEPLKYGPFLVQTVSFALFFFLLILFYFFYTTPFPFYGKYIIYTHIYIYIIYCILWTCMLPNLPRKSARISVNCPQWKKKHKKMLYTGQTTKRTGFSNWNKINKLLLCYIALLYIISIIRKHIDDRRALCLTSRSIKATVRNGF